MVLLNTHADYMNFKGKNLGAEEYPAEYYRNFLLHIKEKYREQYYHTLPNKLVSFYKEFVLNKNQENK